AIATTGTEARFQLRWCNSSGSTARSEHDRVHQGALIGTDPVRALPVEGFEPPDSARAEAVLNTGSLVFDHLTAQRPIARTATASHHAASFAGQPRFAVLTSTGSYSSTRA